MNLSPPNNTLQAEYKARINRVVDHIESDLTQEFTLDALAARAAFSKFHFNRVFRVMTGESLFAFIQRLRLEKAATALLTTPSAPITQIAFNCGFSSSAAFSRSFKRRFGICATQWRQDNKNILDAGQRHGLSSPSAQRTSLVPPEKIRIRDLPDRTLAYVRYTGPYKGDAGLFEDLFTRLYNWAVPRNLADPKGCDSLVLYHDSIHITDQDRLRISACIEVPRNTVPTREIGKMVLPGGRHVCARFRLAPHEYAGAWDWIYACYFPASGFQPGDGLSFEFYPAQDYLGEVHHRLITEICVPVVPL